MKNSMLRSASLLVLLSAALSASAITLTYDASPFTVMQPASGYTDVWFTGTITGTNVKTSAVGFENFLGTSLYNIESVRFSAINAALAATGTYTGELLAFRFYAPGTGSWTTLGPAAVDTTFFFDDRTSVRARLSVDVVPFAAPSSVPGPAALGPFALGALATLRKRRRRA